VAICDEKLKCSQTDSRWREGTSWRRAGSLSAEKDKQEGAGEEVRELKRSEDGEPGGSKASKREWVGYPGRERGRRGKAGQDQRAQERGKERKEGQGRSKKAHRAHTHTHTHKDEEPKWSSKREGQVGTQESTQTEGGSDRR
jgi:hypothetical protein